ncbi:MAG: response regulator transcription factor [Candidatus Cohnella colombiensis]|uniref:Response regulator transcription factor n=1 Tax=Candidatus Cohnella colombiensis TaxID=3121368 RepID=A0AA95EXB0_9BACL|nr:MAG: response regulator transcription factor [Cohnella sp.]
MIDILLVDDHPSVMEGTKVLLEQEGDMKVFFAQTPANALELAVNQHFDVILVDLHMPEMNGIDLAKKALSKSPNITILIYTGFEFNKHFNLMIEAGISGFVLKTANKEQLVTAIRCAMRGEAILPVTLMKQLRRVNIALQNEIEALAITDKEQQILNQIAIGKSNKEIAEDLIMSQRSLEYSLTTLFQKLNVKSRFEAAMKAKQMNLITDLDLPPISK